MLQKNSLLMIACTISSVLSIAQTGKLEGVITTSDQQPAEFVQVMIKSTNKAAYTDESGKYILTPIPIGSCDIVIQRVGITPLLKQVSIEANKTTTLNGTLENSSTQLAEVVIVENNRSDVNTTASKIPLKNLGNTQVYSEIPQAVLAAQNITNLEDVMRYATGVSIVFPATGRVGDVGTYYTNR